MVSLCTSLLPLNPFTKFQIPLFFQNTLKKLFSGCMGLFSRQSGDNESLTNEDTKHLGASLQFFLQEATLFILHYL